jgi:tetratricopeptide (TPR) repeat protein
LKDLGDNQIKSLLLGPVDSSVDVEVLTPEGKIKTTTLLRVPEIKKSLWERKDIIADNYDRRWDRNCNGAFVEDSLDIEARASQNLVMRSAQEWPESGSQHISTAAFTAAITNYQLGNIDDGDFYLELCEKKYEPGKKWRIAQNMQAGKSITTLASVGRLQDAKKLLDMLIEGDGLQQFSYDDAFKALAFAQLKDDKSAAFATLEKFAGLGKGRSTATHWVAEVYQQGGELKKAQEVYSKLIAANFPSDLRWENLQTLSANLYQSAFLQNELGDQSSATASLQQAIDRLKALAATLPDAHVCSQFTDCVIWQCRQRKTKC